jgi:E3 ubiquitin-protein ligase HERC2
MSFGTGQYGALGHGFSAGKQLPDALRPRYIQALAGIRCVCVSAGELHSAVVTSDGDVYTWGDGFCGQLGHGDKSPQTSPVQVNKGGLDDECVSHISCGARHTLAVTEDGEVFSWGFGHFGVLGRAYTPFDYEPEAALMAMGVEEEDGNIDEGQERHDAPAAQNRGQQQQQESAAWDFDNLMAHLNMIKNLSLADSSDQCIPRLIDSLEGIKIIGASAGHRHTLLLDEYGGMYSCGAGITGCLGLGDNCSHSYPMRIKYFDDGNIKIMQMSAGVDMSMAVNTSGKV